MTTLTTILPFLNLNLRQKIVFNFQIIKILYIKIPHTSWFHNKDLLHFLHTFDTHALKKKFKNPNNNI